MKKLLAVGIGALCVASGAMKLMSLRHDVMQHTLVWDLVGGSREVLVALSAAEVAFGVLLAMDVWVRRLAGVGSLAAIASTMVLIGASALGSERPCGCFGEMGGPVSRSLTWGVVRSLALVFALVVLYRSHGTSVR